MMDKTEKEWHEPQSKEVEVKQDSTAMACQGKAIGCYAGSSCGSVAKDQPEPEKE